MDPIPEDGLGFSCLSTRRGYMCLSGEYLVLSSPEIRKCTLLDELEFMDESGYSLSI